MQSGLESLVGYGKGIRPCLAAPAHSPTRPPLEYRALGGRVGEWPGAVSAVMQTKAILDLAKVNRYARAFPGNGVPFLKRVLPCPAFAN